MIKGKIYRTGAILSDETLHNGFYSTLEFTIANYVSSTTILNRLNAHIVRDTGIGSIPNVVFKRSGFNS